MKTCKDWNTCKDCLHSKVCRDWWSEQEENLFSESNIACRVFTDRSEWVHLPCKAADLYSLKAIFKKWIKNKYAIIRYDCQKNKPHKIVSYDIQGKELLKNEDLLLYDYLPSMNFTVIANGFNSQEEAEKALERMKYEDT